MRPPRSCTSRTAFPALCFSALWTTRKTSTPAFYRPVRICAMKLVRVLLPVALLIAPLFTALPTGQNGATSLANSLKFRSIGPASMGGRIDDIAVSESDPNIIYIGYAVGGVFKSENNATTFEPVFETYGTASIGDIAIHPTNPTIVYVGTGESNNRQTSSFGD